jgi:hypothetical protein
MRFKGFSSAYFTATPSEFIDVWLARIDTLAELKVILYVIRRTFGWGKFVDRISVSQFTKGITRRMTVRDRQSVKQVEVQVDHGTGLTKSSVRRGLKRAVEHGYLMRFMVCGRCEQEMFDEKPPVQCPYCQQPYRGRAQFWYSLGLRSPTLAGLAREARFDYLRDLGRSRQDFFAALRELLEPAEEAEEETSNVESVIELLCDFGFAPAASAAIAREALEAGLAEEDVEAWMEHVNRQKNLTNPQGFLRAMLRSGAEPPLDEDEHDPDRYIKGRYADYIKY